MIIVPSVNIGKNLFKKMKEFEVAKTKKKPKKVETADIEEYLKQLPPPPQEHAYELKMEKRLKRMLEEQEKKKKKHKQEVSSENSGG